MSSRKGRSAGGRNQDNILDSGNELTISRLICTNKIIAPRAYCLMTQHYSAAECRAEEFLRDEELPFYHAEEP